jgi:hypothetical protein
MLLLYRLEHERKPGAVDIGMRNRPCIVEIKTINKPNLFSKSRESRSLGDIE